MSRYVLMLLWYDIDDDNDPSINSNIWYLIIRVGFLPEETYFFQDTRKKVEETYFFRFCPDKTGRNWTKLEKTVKDVRNVGRKYLSYLISYKRLWLKMHLVNWYCLKHYAKASTIFDLFLPVLSGQNWKKLDDNWGNFKRCQKYWKKLIIILIFSQKVMVTNTLSWLLLFRNII